MNFRYPIILASNSPRRKLLLEELGVTFSIRTKMVEESYPANLPSREVARFLAKKKAENYNDWSTKNIVICADTTVVLGESVLEKPVDEKEAISMIRQLNNQSHEVITGVGINGPEGLEVFDDVTEVFFSKLSDSEIQHYVTKYKPFDKAGAYGIQEWIGLIGIHKIIGSYFNVVGLPIQKVYQHIKKYESV